MKLGEVRHYFQHICDENQKVNGKRRPIRKKTRQHFSRTQSSLVRGLLVALKTFAAAFKDFQDYNNAEGIKVLVKFIQHVAVRDNAIVFGDYFLRSELN